MIFLKIHRNVLVVKLHYRRAIFFDEETILKSSSFPKGVITRTFLVKHLRVHSYSLLLIILNIEFKEIHGKMKV